MKFGACAWIFGDEAFHVTARRMAAVGLDGIELLGDVSTDPCAICRILADNRLTATSITPSNVDLCHPEASVRRAALDYYLRLIDFAAQVGAPLISCHGQVGRVRALSSYSQEWGWMAESVHAIADHAAERNLRIAVELLNRYEAHILNTAEEGVRFVRQVDARNVGLLLDAYHMNIEEHSLPAAIECAKDAIFLVHIADSNRQGMGHGHTDFRALIGALRSIHYDGDFVFECVAAGPDPFAAIKGSDSQSIVETYLRESLPRLRNMIYEHA
jgi:D-psicose/D-tagatose/L-ribulose 3-epimerase